VENNNDFASLENATAVVFLKELKGWDHKESDMTEQLHSCTHSTKLRTSLVAQQKRIHLPMQEIRVPSLGQEDPLEEEMAANSSILA